MYRTCNSLGQFCKNTMVRLTNSSVLLADRIRKFRYIAFAFLLFDLVYGSILTYFFESFRANILGYYTISLLYIFAVLSAAFGVKDKNVLLLYPILVFTIPILILCIFFITTDLVQIVVCSRRQAYNSTFTVNMPMVHECTNRSVTLKASVLYATLGFVVLIEKILEFFVIRWLMDLLGLLKETTVINFVHRRSIQVSNNGAESRRTTSSYGQARLEKTINEMHDTDDDMVVYQSKDSENLPSTIIDQSISPPVYRERVTTPGQYSDDILPIKKQSKHGIE